MAEKILKSG